MSARTTKAAAAAANATTVAHIDVVATPAPTPTPAPVQAEAITQAPAVPEPVAVQAATRTPEQQAELDQLRANRDAMQAKAAQAAAPAAGPLTPERMEALSALADLLLPQSDDSPEYGWKRCLATFFVGIAVTAGAATGVHLAASWAMAAIMAATGSAVLMYAVAALAYIIGAWAAVKLGGMASNYILSGALDRHVGAITAPVRGWFAKKPAVVQVAPAPAAAQ